MSFTRLLSNAMKSENYNQINNEELDVPIFNILYNDYTKEENNFISNIVDIGKTIFSAEETSIKYELNIYEDILLDCISKEECLKFAKARIKNKFNSGSEDKIDVMNYLLNNTDFIDYYADYLKNFKIKVKVLNGINNFLLQQINNDVNVESIRTINNNIITKFDEDIANSFKIIEDYISKILASECIEFTAYLNSLFE